MTTPADYEQIRSEAAARRRAMARAGREIGAIPPVKNVRRRRATRLSLRVMCERYFKSTFYLKWGDDHLKAIAKIERAVLHGGLMAFAMRRGAGKTSLCECAALWALLHSHRRFVAIIGSEAGAASEILDSIKLELETNEKLAEDFPEVCYPIQKLEGIAQRARGQLHNGKRTHIRWEANEIILPTIDGSAASGAIVRVAGITGRIRGMKHKGVGGRADRPDLVIVDDPQTRESARSREQSHERLMIIKNDVLGLAGPGKRIAGFCACTVITRGDLADQLLDREQYPEWQGERFKMVYAFPTNTHLWAEYEQQLLEDIKAERGTRRATEFYRSNREAMDAGAVVAWPAAHEPGEISAIQSAMNLKILKPSAFWSEYQNEPQDDSPASSALTAQQIACKLNGTERGIVPLEATHLVAFIDVGDVALPFVVAAWADDFTGAVIHYGMYPDQHQDYFSLRNASHTLASVMPHAGLEGRIYGGLDKLTSELLARTWRRFDGVEMRIERCLIDANWGASTSTIYQFCRQSPHSAVLLPSHGRYVGASSVPFDQYKKRTGERIGHNWRIPSVRGTRAIRHVTFDSNYWKSFVYARLAVPMGDAGCLSLFGNNPEQHRLFADHVTAEYPVRTKGRGRELDEWKQKPNAPDNHWFDCLVGCAVAASMQGASLGAARNAGTSNQHAGSRMRFSELQRLKRMRQQ